MSRARDLASIFNLSPLSGTTAERPSTAPIGQIYYNGTTAKQQIYTTTGWQDVASGIPFGNTSSRPSSPAVGQPYFNGEAQRLELYTGPSYGWQNIVAETPGVTGYSGTVLETNNINTINITGTNFAAGAVASLVGQDGTEYISTTTTVNNLTSISATFGSIPANNEPYDIKVTNPSNLYGVYYDILTVNDKPIWQTAAGTLGTFNELSSISINLSATDEEGNSVTYSSSNLPAWLSLNSATGALTGTAPSVSSTSTYSFTVSASDGINTSQPRAFNVIISDVLFTAEFLLIGGGGGGGSQVGGGGGAGGVLYASSYNINKSTAYSVSIGNGGVGGPWQGSGSRPGSYGGNSTFGTLIAYGGGGGGAHGSGTPASGADGYVTQAGRPGGSGGGGGANDSNGPGGAATQTSQSGVNGYGFAGGTGTVTNWAGGGGGGAGGAGANSTSNNGGAGGAGVQYSITGTSLYYAGGGGGCGNLSESSGALGGSGVGGNGKGNTNNTNTKLTTDGAANTGSGGGGARDTGPGGDGAAGVLIIAYPDTIPAATISGGLTYNQPTRSGYRVYRITSGTGTVTF